MSDVDCSKIADERRGLALNWVFGVLVGALLLLFVVVMAPWSELGCDEAAWATSVVKVLKGKVLGQEAVMAKGPYLVVWHLLVYVATGPNVMALHLIGAGWAMLTGIVICLVGLRLAGRAGFLLTGLLYAAAMADPAVRANVYPEILMVLPLALGMLALAAGLSRGNTALVGVAGLCAGLAVLTKQTAAFSCLAMAVVVVLAHCFAAGIGGRGVLRRIARDWLALSAGGLLAALPWLVYVWQHRAGAGFMQNYVTGPMEYVAGIAAPQVLANLAWSLVQVAPRYTFVLVASVAGLGYLLRMSGSLLKKVRTQRGAGEKHEADRAEAILYVTLCAWYLSALVGVAVTGRFSAHYFSQLFPSAALLGGIWIAHKLQHEGGSRPTGGPGVSGAHLRAKLNRLNVAALVLAAQMMVLVPIVVISIGRWHMAVAVTATPSPWRQVGEYIGEHTDPQDTVFVWGDQTEVLYWAGRELASDQPWVTVRMLGFVHNRPVFSSRITEQIHWQRLRQDLDRWQPAYVVVAPAIKTVEPQLAGQFGPDRLPELRRILDAGFKYETAIAGYEIYAKRPTMPGRDALLRDE